MVAAGCAVVWRWARAAADVRRTEVDALKAETRTRQATVDRLARGAQGGRLPLLGETTLEVLGVRRPRHGADGSEEQLPYAARHQLDPQLRAVLAAHSIVLVHGPSAAGKSRSAAEAARGLYDRRPVVVPEIEHDALQVLLDAGTVPPGAVIWLDDRWTSRTRAGRQRRSNPSPSDGYGPPSTPS
ncbi:hypothetical protein [Micromonospora sp. NPDC005087]|uniref:hypothetical protein n=1 Tax=Micromonospora sp. NPDC005087 TaxID=3364225 RepID=UPI0036B20EAC